MKVHPKIKIFLEREREKEEKTFRQVNVSGVQKPNDLILFNLMSTNESHMMMSEVEVKHLAAVFCVCSVGVEEVESSGGVQLLSGSVSLVIPEAGLVQRGTLRLL